MLKALAAVESRGDYRLWLRFEDGLEGDIDLEPLLKFEGVFAPLRGPAYFAQARVDPELGTLSWPNGADWDSLVLYSLLSGRSLEELLTETTSAGR
jgi:hypothetical protein